MSRRVALVSIADRDRAMLAEYLRNSGFDIYVCDELAIGSAFGALILLGHEIPTNDLRGRIRAWMKANKQQTIVVVTSKPTALEDLRAAHSQRLFVFASPVFGWDVVDALRAGEPPQPRSA